MWNLNYFFKSCGRLAALCEIVCPAAVFKGANGATEVLNTASTHNGEADVVISEVFVQKKDWTKCIWTHEHFFPLFSYFVSFLGLLGLFLSHNASSSSFFCFLKHIRLIKHIMLRVTV